MSTLKVDTLVAADGSSAVTLTKQSAAKMFYNINGTGTIALRDSLNISSATDKGTGDYKVAFASNFNATDYTPVGNHGTTDTNWNNSYHMAQIMGAGISSSYAAVYTTSELGFCNFGNGTPADIDMELGNAHGDLA
jgi:hypothetical protein